MGIFIKGRYVDAIHIKGRDVAHVYINGRLVWPFIPNIPIPEEILSCYYNGYWIDEYPWTDDTPWTD